MPANMTIAVFVLGAVLLLVAIVGGRFRIFGAEVSGMAGPAGRRCAAVIGSVLIVFGLYGALPGEKPPQPPDAPTSAPSALLGYPIKDDDLVSADGVGDGHDTNWRFVTEALEKGEIGIFQDTVTESGYFSVSIRSKEHRGGLPVTAYVTRFIPKEGQTVWSFREAIKDQAGWKTRIDPDLIGLLNP